MVQRLGLAALGPSSVRQAPGILGAGQDPDGKFITAPSRTLLLSLRGILGAGQDPDGEFVTTPSRTLLLSLKQTYRPPLLAETNISTVFEVLL
jgi:hypothetical protein